MSSRYQIEPGVKVTLPEDARWVQFTGALPQWQHEWLGDWLARHPGTTLRIYGNYRGDITDLEFLRHYRQINGFGIDCIYGQIGDLAGLRFLPDEIERLDIGIPTTGEAEELLSRTTNLRELSIAEHRRLPESIQRQHQLRELLLVGPFKDVDAISCLTSIEELRLISAGVRDLASLVPLTELTKLELRSGIRDLSLLPELESLTELDLCRLRGLSDVSAVGDVETLEKLSLESLSQVTTLPDMHRLLALREVAITNLKGLTDLTPLASAPSLERLLLIEMKHLPPQAVTPLIGHPTLQRARIGLGSARKNDEASALLGLPNE